MYLQRSHRRSGVGAGRYRAACFESLQMFTIIPSGQDGPTRRRAYVLVRPVRARQLVAATLAAAGAKKRE
jgi:hypothetical protein